MLKNLVTRVLRRFRSCDALDACLRSPVSKISRVWLTPLPKVSPWILPRQINYIENGEQKSRDVIKVFDSVLVILFNVSRKKLIYVRQFRPAVYQSFVTGNNLDLPRGNIDLIKYPPELAVTLEQCAGLVDKNNSLEEIAREEVLEECGYDVPANSLQLIYKYKSGVGTSSSEQTLFYCEVCDDQKVSDGGGIHNEVIQVVELSIEDAKKLVNTGSNVISAPGTLLGTLWFLGNKT